MHVALSQSSCRSRLTRAGVEHGNGLLSQERWVRHQTGLSDVLIHCLAAPTFARYHATVASMPACSGILGSHPASRKTETSSSLRGVPSGFVGSQRVSPL